MITQAFAAVIQGILGVFGIFDYAMINTGAWKYIFGVVVAMLVFRFIVYPYLKSGVANPDGKEE